MVQYNLVEIGTDTDSTYLYGFCEAIDHSNPNIVIVNYKKINKLQELLAKKICLHILKQPLIQANSNYEKEKRK